jgi:hypothetical protein
MQMGYRPEDEVAVLAKIKQLKEDGETPVSALRVAQLFRGLFPDGQPDIAATAALLDRLAAEGKLTRESQGATHAAYVAYDAV